MSDITIWHNPRCSKSRAGLEVLEESGKEFNIYKYLDENPSSSEIAGILSMLSLNPRELMRTGEDIYKELGLKDEMDDTKLIEAMANNPKLIERPIVVVGDKAVIGRPLDNVIELLG